MKTGLCVKKGLIWGYFNFKVKKCTYISLAKNPSIMIISKTATYSFIVLVIRQSITIICRMKTDVWWHKGNFVWFKCFQILWSEDNLVQYICEQALLENGNHISYLLCVLKKIIVSSGTLLFQPEWIRCKVFFLLLLFIVYVGGWFTLGKRPLFNWPR